MASVPLLSTLRTTLAADREPPVPDPPIRKVVHQLHDPDQFSTAVSGAELRTEFLQRSQGVTAVEQFQSPDWALDFYDARVTARITGRSVTGWGSIALMTNDAPSRWYGRSAVRGVLVFTPPGELIDGCIVPGFRSIALHVPPPVWERCHRLVVPDAPVGCRPAAVGSVRRLTTPGIDAFEARLLALRRQLASGNDDGAVGEVLAAGRRLATDLVTVAWELQSAGDDPARDRHGAHNRTRIARRAEDWLRLHLREPFAIPDVCFALGVSRRELEYAFRQTFDQSPREFLQALRLNAIHRALRKSPPGRSHVTRIALDHGVTHLGRFAARYRQLFGELPSSSASR